ncbi:hypothetical protein DL771_006364 [Monosporascus sp. 5C6A]|nr:hypothetical protein DL771_006364 [Monosporascus sp. 5C6A]
MPPASPQQHNYYHVMVRQAVCNFDCYPAAIINPNATTLLQEAVTIGNSSYDPPASRQILFDLHSCISLNLGVLFAWSAVTVALFSLCCYFMRWKSGRTQRAAGGDKDKCTVNTKDGEKKFWKDVSAKPPKRRRGFLRGMWKLLDGSYVGLGVK